MLKMWTKWQNVPMQSARVPQQLAPMETRISERMKGNFSTVETAASTTTSWAAGTA
jgi:hypothetical protein